MSAGHVPTHVGGTTGTKQRPMVNPGRRRGRMLLGLGVVVLTVVLGAVWSFVAQRQLASSLVIESTEHLDHAHKAFEIARARVQTALQAHCRVLVEDPRLKSTLATEGMDEPTVADILTDLGKLRGSGFLMVLSPEGRVFAQAGAPELRGLDLSASSVVKKVQGTTVAVAGSWVLAGKVMDLSIMAIRYGEDVVAYLVVGESVDAPLLREVSDQTGVHVASALANTVTLASTTDARTQAAFTAIAAEPGTFTGRVSTHGGDQYVTGLIELGETAQSHRLVLARPVTSMQPAFEPLRWMLFVPPLLVLIAVLFSMSVTRSRRS